MSSDTKHLHWLSDWSEFAFSLCFEIKAKVFLKYSFMIRKPTLSYGKWTLSWRHGRGWEHHDWEISHFLTFTLLLIHLGLFPPIFFSAVLRDRALDDSARGAQSWFSLEHGLPENIPSSKLGPAYRERIFTHLPQLLPPLNTSRNLQTHFMLR